MITEDENLSVMSEETDEGPAKIPLEGLIRYLNKKLGKKEARISELEKNLDEMVKDNARLQERLQKAAQKIVVYESDAQREAHKEALICTNQELLYKVLQKKVVNLTTNINSLRKTNLDLLEELLKWRKGRD